MGSDNMSMPTADSLACRLGDLLDEIQWDVEGRCIECGRKEHADLCIVRLALQAYRDWLKSPTREEKGDPRG